MPYTPPFKQTLTELTHRFVESDKRVDRGASPGMLSIAGGLIRLNITPTNDPCVFEALCWHTQDEDCNYFARHTCGPHVHLEDVLDSILSGLKDAWRARANRYDGLAEGVADAIYSLQEKEARFRALEQEAFDVANAVRAIEEKEVRGA